MNELVFTIDADVRRRASVAFYLNNRGIFAEPFETIEEFLGTEPAGGVVLVHNDKSAVASVIHDLCNRQSWLPIVAYSQDPRPSDVVEAVIDGAVGYVAWPGCGENLVSVLRNARVRPRTDMIGGPRQTFAAARLEKLSRRERQILAGMAKGYSNRVIAQHLAISPRTVELHRSNVLLKSGAKHSAEAIRLAIEAALPSFEPPALHLV